MAYSQTSKFKTSASLSDKDRPSRLAEMFSDIYTDQWNEAFEELQKSFSNDEEIIEILLQILMDIDAFCKHLEEEQIENLKKTLILSSSLEGTKIIFPENVTHQLNVCRKSISHISKEYVYKMYMSSLKTKQEWNWKFAFRTKTFVQGCLEICWLMNLQDPPVVFGTMAKYGEALKPDIYKPFIQSGPYIKYIVWPSLLLHKDGPLLAKGVAQGFDRHCDASSEDTRHKISKKKTEPLDCGPTFGHNYNEHALLSQPYKDVSYRSTTVPYVHECQRQTKGVKTFYQYPEYQIPSTKTECQDEPSVNDMKLFFRYIDRSDFSGARNVLGDKKYSKCWMCPNERYKFT